MIKKLYRISTVIWALLSVVSVLWLLYGVLTPETNESNPTLAKVWAVTLVPLGISILLTLFISQISYILFSLRHKAEQLNLLEKLVMAFVVSIMFAAGLLLLTLPFMVPLHEGATFAERVAMGDTNQNRIVVMYGVFAVAASAILFRIPKLNFVIVFLLAYWVIGTGLVIGLKTYQPANGYVCKRTEPYNIPSEFSRAINLIEDRMQLERGFPFRNCIYIEYRDLGGTGTEGYFTFSKDSDPQRLEIYVDTKYQSKDELLTSLLLVHELTHVEQYISRLHESSSPNAHICFMDEVDAFYNELLLSLNFNPEETESLRSRISEFYRSTGTTPTATLSGSNYESIVYLSQLQTDGYTHCKKSNVIGTDNFGVCVTNQVKESLLKEVMNTEVYKQQCELIQ